MIIFPAIDLKDGKAVRLFQGDYDKDKFAGFIAREAKFEIGSFVQKSATKMGAKLRSLWQTMNSQQVIPADDQR